MRKKKPRKGLLFVGQFGGVLGVFLLREEVMLVLALRLGHGFCFAKAVLSASLEKRKVNFSFLLVFLKGRTYGSHPSIHLITK